jgi:hypothetical protein
MNINQQYMYAHVNVWYCKMCIFVVLCVDETLFYMREYSDAIERGGQRLQIK